MSVVARRQRTTERSPFRLPTPAAALRATDFGLVTRRERPSGRAPHCKAPARAPNERRSRREGPGEVDRFSTLRRRAALDAGQGPQPRVPRLARSAPRRLCRSTGDRRSRRCAAGQLAQRTGIAGRGRTARPSARPFKGSIRGLAAVILAPLDVVRWGPVGNA
jgi:hypothetical protein